MKPVHPRWRGEHEELRMEYDAPSGSSPLARGTLPSMNFRPRSRRFIPAGAGNTWPHAASR